MKKEYRGHKYEITARGGRFHLVVWPPDFDPRSPGLSWGSPRTEEAAEQMVKDWIDVHEGPDRTERISKRIFAALCMKARDDGPEAEMTREELEKAVRAPHQDFVGTLNRLHVAGGIYIRVVDGDPDRIALGTRWRQDCEA